MKIKILLTQFLLITISNINCVKVIASIQSFPSSTNLPVNINPDKEVEIPLPQKYLSELIIPLSNNYLRVHHVKSAIVNLGDINSYFLIDSALIDSAIIITTDSNFRLKKLKVSIPKLYSIEIERKYDNSGYLNEEIYTDSILHFKKTSHFAHKIVHDTLFMALYDSSLISIMPQKRPISQKTIFIRHKDKKIYPIYNEQNYYGTPDNHCLITYQYDNKQRLREVHMFELTLSGNIDLVKEKKCIYYSYTKNHDYVDYLRSQRDNSFLFEFHQNMLTRVFDEGFIAYGYRKSGLLRDAVYSMGGEPATANYTFIQR